MQSLLLCLLLCAGTAAPAQSARILPAANGEGINRGQPFDRKLDDPAVYAGRTYFIWGSQKPVNPSPAIGSKYQPYSRDPDRSDTLQWYQQNHPEWVEYGADRATPAYGYLYASGNAMSIDITNPAVREWYWATYVQPFVNAGYPVFAFDNVNLQNEEKRVGHFDGQGRWVPQFSGRKIDNAYTAAVLDWMLFLCTRLHAAGIGVAANITFPLGKPQLEPAMRRLIEMVDIWADEQGLTNHNDAEISDNAWQRKFDFVRSVETTRIHWAVNETSQKHLADASTQQIDWAVGNYYLYREKNSLLTLCGEQEYGVYTDTPAMHLDLGHAIEVAKQQSPGTWIRRYSEGFVAVNPSSHHFVTVSLPPGRWLDSHGRKQALSFTLAPVSALLLKRQR